MQLQLKKKKITSWKQYCNMTSSINPWNEVYKLATCKRKNNTKKPHCGNPTEY